MQYLHRYIFFLFVGLFLNTSESRTQNFAPKDFYLVDSLNIKDLSIPDKQFLDSCLFIYHSSEHDTTRIKVINHICDNLAHYLWLDKKYLNFILDVINKKIEQGEKPEMFYKSKKADVLNSISIGYLQQGNHVDALILCIKSLKLCKEINSFEGISTGLNNLGRIYESQGKHSKSINCYMKSLGLAKRNGLSYAVSVCLNSIAHSYYIQGNIPEALRYIHKSLNQFKEIGDEEGVVETLTGIGFIYKYQGDLFQALRYYQKALKLAQKGKNKKAHAGLLLNIGAIHTRQGKYVTALDHYNKGLKLSKEIGDKHGTASSWLFIGGIYHSQRELSKALNCYEKGASLFKMIKDEVGLSKALSSIGVIHKHRGEFDQALYYYKKSLNFYKKRGNKKEEVNTLLLIGNIYYEKGDSHSFLSFKKSLEKSKKIDYKEGLAKSLLSMGFYYLELDQEKALSFFGEALEKAKEIGMPTLVSSSAKNLYEIYEKENKHKLALEMYKLHVQMKDSINSKEVQEKLTVLENKHLLEKKEQQIRSLNQEKKLKDTRFRFTLVSYTGLFIIILALVFGWFYIKKRRLETELNTLRTLKLETFNSTNQERPSSNSIQVTINKRLFSVNLSEIIYFKTQNRYVFLTNSKGKSHVVDDNMGSLEQSLPTNFVRVHRSAIINCNKISNITKTNRGKFVFIMNNPSNSKITSSYSYADKSKGIFEDFQMNKVKTRLNS